MAGLVAHQCPNCGAAVQAPQAGVDQATCEYCKQRFRFASAPPAQQPQPAAGAARPALPRWLALTIALSLVAVIGVIVFATLKGDEERRGRNKRSFSRVSVGQAARQPPKPATATFEPHHDVPSGGSGSSRYVFGVVRNTSEVALRKPRVTVVMLDAAGKELGTDFGYADDDVIEPGETSPIKILIKNAPRYAKLRYELRPKRARYRSKRAKGLRLEPLSAGPESYGWRFKGKVHNDGRRPARFVRVRVVGYDKANKIVGLGFTYVDGGRLEPGAYSRYSTSVYFYGEVKRHALTLTGRPDRR